MSQQWCRRKGMVPDNIKGMKGNDGGNDIKGNGNDKSAVEEPNILKYLAAKEKSKGKREDKCNGKCKAKWINPERAALAYAEKAEAERLAWLQLEQRRLAWEADQERSAITSDDDDTDNDDEADDDGGEFKEADIDNFSNID